jgi:RNA recognition motif-containing protein
MVKLFIVGFPRDMEENELKEMFSKYGEVVSVKIVTEQLTGKSRGYAFLRMKDQAAAVRAIALMDGAEIDDRRISVRVAVDKQAFSQKTYSESGQTLSPLSTSQYVEEHPGTKKKKRPRIQRQQQG